MKKRKTKPASKPSVSNRAARTGNEEDVLIQVGDKTLRLERGLPVREVLRQAGPKGMSKATAPVLGALVNNDVCSLSYPLQTGVEIRWLSLADRDGIRIFKRSLTFLLGKVIRETFPKAQFAIGHAIGPGVYCSFNHGNNDGEEGIDVESFNKINKAMQALVKADLPIERVRITFAEAWAHLEAAGETDKLNLLRYSNPPRLTVLRCGDYEDLFNGVLADSTGVLGMFRLRRYKSGLILQFPERDETAPDGMALKKFDPQKHLFEIFETHSRWGNIIGLNTLGDLNTKVAEGELQEVILTTEAMHEKRLGRIADRIASRRERVRWVLIAGPSSSGKTTTARKLAIHLKVNGLRPVTLECDNYFVNRDRTPTAPDGSFDFEHIDAVDRKRLQKDLKALRAGKRIELPRFNFVEGRQEPSGEFLQLEDDQVVIIEGIHGLNPLLTDGIPEAEKFMLYISCLTQLRLDSTNRLSTTDMRLLRRTVRDNQFRGHSARRTIEMWPSVRRGERRWIFPFQKQANMVFNSSLEYELAIFQPFALPVLREIKPFHPEYAEARRLQDLLELVHPADASLVPPSSLLREFIGGSVFES